MMKQGSLINARPNVLGIEEDHMLSKYVHEHMCVTNLQIYFMYTGLASKKQHILSMIARTRGTE